MSLNHKTIIEFEKPIFSDPISFNDHRLQTEIYTSDKLPKGFANRLNDFLKTELQGSENGLVHFAVKHFKNRQHKGRHMNPCKITL